MRMYLWTNSLLPISINQNTLVIYCRSFIDLNWVSRLSIRVYIYSIYQFRPFLQHNENCLDIFCLFWFQFPIKWCWTHPLSALYPIYQHYERNLRAIVNRSEFVFELVFFILTEDIFGVFARTRIFHYFLPKKQTFKSYASTKKERMKTGERRISCALVYWCVTRKCMYNTVQRENIDESFCVFRLPALDSANLLLFGNIGYLC